MLAVIYTVRIMHLTRNSRIVGVFVSQGNMETGILFANKGHCTVSRRSVLMKRKHEMSNKECQSFCVITYYAASSDKEPAEGWMRRLSLAPIVRQYMLIYVVLVIA